MKLKRLLKLGTAVSLLFLLCICLLNISRTRLGNNLQDATNNLDSVKDKTRFNALVVGTDAGGKLTDAIILVNVDKPSGKISLLSIPRDTKVKIDGKNRKINACYSIGGIDLLLSQVKNLTGAQINYYAVIKPGTLANIVDALGGVEYEVERDMFYQDPSQNLYIDLKKGKQTLDGDKAEQYCRFRSYPLGDIERTAAQRRFLTAMLEQKLKLKYAIRLGEVYDAVKDGVETNVTFGDVVQNITLMQTLGEINNFETPGSYNDMQKEKVSYYIIEDGHLDKLRGICNEHFNIAQNS